MPDHTPPDLAVLALRYAAGDLPEPDMLAFEARLADDQPARDALSEAMRLSASAVGQPPAVPSASVRASVRERLFPTWRTRLFPRRSYRGHPAAWATLGGSLSAAVVVVLVSAGGTPPTASSPAQMAPMSVPSGAAMFVPPEPSLLPPKSVPAAVPADGPRADAHPMPAPMPPADPLNG